MSFEIDVQTVIYTTLANDAPLTALVTGVYDNVPQANDAGSGSAFPYVTIGEDVHTDWSTDTESGDDVTITIHTWSRERGRKEAKQIQGAVYDALHRAELVFTNYKFVACDWLQSESFMDTDGLTRHGVQTFRIILDQL